MRRIRIQKLGEVVGALPAASKEEYVPGTHGVTGKSIPIEYTLEGTLVNPLTVGESVIVLRETRNGVAATGLFQSSPVTLITNTSFYTANSVYDYSYLTPDKDVVSFSA
jgi:hypothetical protein